MRSTQTLVDVQQLEFLFKLTNRFVTVRSTQHRNWRNLTLSKTEVIWSEIYNLNARQIMNGLHGFIYTFTGLKPKPNAEIIKEGNWH